MTRGRKPQGGTPPVEDVVDTSAVVRAQAASELVSAATFEIVQSAELHKLVGMMEAAHFVETVSGKLMAETYLKAKALLGKVGQVTVAGPDGTPETVSDMERFCELTMPISARRCRQIVSSIETLGADLYEQAERIGFRARDYQALKALPAPDQAAVKEALESGDRSLVMDVMSRLVEQNAAASAVIAEKDKQIAAKEKVLAKKEQTITRYEEQAAMRGALGTDEQATLDALRDVTLAAEIALAQLSSTISETLNGAPTEAMAAAARHAGEYTAQRLADLLHQHGIPVDFVEMLTPTWLSGTEAQALAEAAAKPRSKK